jgi:peptide/nickel transport system substrate-binding protein
MKRSFSVWLVISSLFAPATGAAATRPHYGGMLHVTMRAAPPSLDPTKSSPADWFASSHVSRILFDTLVSFDERGDLQPALAISWHADPGNQRWQFHLRSGVTFSDKTPLTADVVAGSLRTSNPYWKILSANDDVLVETDSPDPNLAAELVLPQYSIVHRQGNQISGTGPFVISHWDPGKQLTVTAREDYWGSRPFVDSIEIAFGQSLREQAIALDLRKAQIVEAAPLGRSSSTENYTVGISAPVELMALLFSPARSSPEDARLRDVLALSIDRGSLNSVVLQGGGEPSAALLPNWMTGYQFVFPREANLARARQEFSETRQKKPWTLGYDAADPMARVIAERIVLNARDAGLLLQLTSGSADLRLVRVPMVCPDSHVDLARLAEMLGLPRPKFASNAIDDLYAAESNLLASRQIIPLLHLRTASQARASVHDWADTQDGIWRLQSVWLGPENLGGEKP